MRAGSSLAGTLDRGAFRLVVAVRCAPVSDGGDLLQPRRLPDDLSHDERLQQVAELRKGGGVTPASFSAKSRFRGLGSPILRPYVIGKPRRLNSRGITTKSALAKPTAAVTGANSVVRRDWLWVTQKSPVCLVAPDHLCRDVPEPSSCRRARVDDEHRRQLREQLVQQWVDEAWSISARHPSYAHDINAAEAATSSIVNRLPKHAPRACPGRCSPSVDERKGRCMGSGHL